MLEQSLDKGGEWVTAGQFTVDRNLINYEYTVDLNYRADALLVDVRLEDFRETWQRAGELMQLWDTEGESYQTAYGVIRLQQKTVVEISPLSTSKLVFRPVEWLQNWTIEIKARLAPLSNRDLLNQVAVLQQTITAGVSNLENNTNNSQAIPIMQENLSLINQKLDAIDFGDINTDVSQHEASKNLTSSFQNNTYLNFGFFL